jgi:O-antigen ligase
MQKLLELLNKTFKYLIAFLLILVPLYPKFPFIQIPGIYVSVRAEDFLIAAIAVFTLIRVIPDIKRLLKDEIVRAVAVFLAVGLISLISGVFLTKTAVLSIGALHFFRRVEYFVPFLAILAFFPYDKGKNLGFYIRVLVIVVLVAFIYGFGQMHFGFPVITTQDSESSKGIAMVWTAGAQITSTFAGHYDLAAFMVLVLPILISLIFTVSGKFSKLLLSLAALSGFWLLIYTASRISLASYLASVCISLFLLKKYKALVFIVLVSVVLSGFSSSLFARYKNLIDVYSLNIFNITVSAKEPTPEPTPVPVPVFEDRSTSIRLAVEWPRAIRSFVKNPLLGTGYSSTGLATDNDYLRLLAEVGFLGFVSFMLIIIRILFVFASALPLTRNFSGIELGFVAGAIGSFLGTLLNAVFIDVFEASKFAIIFWLIIGLAVCTVREGLNVDKN